MTIQYVSLNCPGGRFFVAQRRLHPMHVTTGGDLIPIRNDRLSEEIRVYEVFIMA